MKQKLLDILKNPRDRLICIDMDGTLCEGEFWGCGEEPKPKQAMIAQVWAWYRKGAHIIIYTARMPQYYPETLAWLTKYNVPFHGITLRVKQGCDLYIDDKALNIDDIDAYTDDKNPHHKDLTKPQK